MLKKSVNSPADEHLVATANGGDNEAMALLITRMLPLIRKTASASRTFCNIDAEDLIQEGLIGLLCAIRSFDCNKEASFRTYANVCISNSIRSAVRKTRNSGVIPDNAKVSIDEAVTLRSDALDDPQDIIVGIEEASRLSKNMDRHLSETELRVLKLYLLGDSYSVIAEKLSLKSEKSVDNALQRIRKKLKSFS